MSGTVAEVDRVVVVDDDPNIRQLVSRALAPKYQVLTAVDVPTAEEVLRENEVKVIICDDQMPGETGLMFLSRIRNQMPFTRRILLTGNGEQSALVFAINEVNVFRYLIKPVAIEDLRRLVAEGVAHYDQARQAAGAAGDAARLRMTVARHLTGGANVKDPTAHERRAWLRTAGMGGMLLLVLLGLGICVLAALYFLKSWLGIDLFTGSHLQDLWR